MPNTCIVVDLDRAKLDTRGQVAFDSAVALLRSLQDQGAGVISMSGPKPRKGRPTVHPDDRSITPQMRIVFDALPDDGFYVFVRTISEKTDLSEQAVRANLKLLKDRKFVTKRESNERGANGRYYAIWARAVMRLPEDKA